MTEGEDLLVGAIALAVVDARANAQNQKFFDEHGYVPWHMRHRWLAALSNTVVMVTLFIAAAAIWEDWVVIRLVKHFHLYNPLWSQPANCGWALFLFSLPFMIALAWWGFVVYRRADQRWRSTATPPAHVVGTSVVPLEQDGE